MSKVEITVGVAGTGSFILDGHDVGGAVVGFDMDARVGRTPRIRLDLGITTTYITGEFDVCMTDYTAELLQKAGWTPPKRVEAIALASASEPKPPSHGYTSHGWPCCDQAAPETPAVVAKCGGPGLCKRACGAEVDVWHGSEPKPAEPEATA